MGRGVADAVGEDVVAKKSCGSCNPLSSFGHGLRLPSLSSGLGFRLRPSSASIHGVSKTRANDRALNVLDKELTLPKIDIVRNTVVFATAERVIQSLLLAISGQLGRSEGGCSRIEFGLHLLHGLGSFSGWRVTSRKKPRRRRGSLRMAKSEGSGGPPALPGAGYARVDERHYMLHRRAFDGDMHQHRGQLWPSIIMLAETTAHWPASVGRKWQSRFAPAARSQWDR